MAAVVKQGIYVVLFKNGVQVDRQPTNASGIYTFSALTPADDYTVAIEKPADGGGYTYTFANVVISHPLATITSETTANHVVHVVANTQSTAVFTYNKNAV